MEGLKINNKYKITSEVCYLNHALRESKWKRGRGGRLGVTLHNKVFTYPLNVLLYIYP